MRWGFGGGGFTGPDVWREPILRWIVPPVAWMKGGGGGRRRLGGVLDTSGRLQFIISPVVSVGRLIVFLVIVNLSIRRRRSSEEQS